MKYLLDTCALIWLLENPERLSEKAVDIIENPHNEVFASTISFWELSLKHSLGKLSLESIDLEELEEILTDKLFIGIIGLSEQETLSFHHLPFPENHRDPFDRMLAWQAIKRNMALISSEPVFRPYQQCGLRVVW
jgi:PIN domain nuclease of toxin-antitoxin system